MQYKQVLQPKDKKVYVIIEITKNDLILEKQLKLHDLSIREYLDNKYALWLDFKTIDENIK